jgi:hypothetical protein
MKKKAGKIGEYETESCLDVHLRIIHQTTYLTINSQQ